MRLRFQRLKLDCDKWLSTVVFSLNLRRHIQAALYVFAFAMPLTQLAVLAVLWLAPLSRSAQRRAATVRQCRLTS